MGIRNEQWGTVYTDRLERFLKPLRESHPEIKLVGSSGPDPEGEAFESLWKEMRRLNVDLVDEHFYRNEKWFISHSDRYDNYPRT